MSGLADIWEQIRRFIEGILDEPPILRCIRVCEVSAVGHATSVALMYYVSVLDRGEHFSPFGLKVFYLLSASLILLWLLLAFIARRLSKRHARVAWIEYIFSSTWGFAYTFLIYWSGIYSSPYWTFVISGTAIALMLLEQRMVMSISLLTLAGLLLAAIAEAWGSLPVSPLFHTFPIGADGVASAAWKLAFIGILSGFIVPCLVLAAVMFRRWYEREDQFRRLAVRDGLTGLFNRRYFLEQFEAEFDRSRRHGHPLSFLIIDVDHFKKINDHHGHQTGDRALIEVARTLELAVRKSDLVARYGGEEFVVLLPETGTDGACEVGERCRQEIEKLEIAGADASAFSVTISLGLAQYPAHSAGTGRIDDLVHQADQALYQAKQSGRNRLVVAGAILP